MAFSISTALHIAHFYGFCAFSCAVFLPNPPLSVTLQADSQPNIASSNTLAALQSGADTKEKHSTNHLIS